MSEGIHVTSLVQVGCSWFFVDSKPQDTLAGAVYLCVLKRYSLLLLRDPHYGNADHVFTIGRYKTMFLLQYLRTFSIAGEIL